MEVLTKLKLTRCLLVGLALASIASAHHHVARAEEGHEASQHQKQQSPLAEGRSYTGVFNDYNELMPSSWMNGAYEKLALPEVAANAGSNAAPMTSVTLYKQPNSLLISILKQMFTDIDWDTIEEARVQIEKFIHRVEQIVGTFRSVFTRNFSSSSASSSTTSAASNNSSASSETAESRDASGPTGRWWGGSKGNKAASEASKVDATRVKEMLERVACFVGYARLMNLGNEALAELDASKVVTNLFGSAASKRNSSGWKWFG